MPDTSILIKEFEHSPLNRRGQILLRYDVEVGIAGHPALGVGTYRATDYGDGLILEATDDVKNKEENGFPRRYTNVGVVDNVADARKPLYNMAVERAKDLRRVTGLSISDLVESVPSRLR